MNNGPSILLVEDEENLHEALKLNLELEGYQVSSARDGAEALRVLEQEHFELIILDIMLPEMDGITVAENIRIRNLEIPILMLSARNSSADRVLGLKKGADDYLTKPFNLEELLLRVSKLIENKNEVVTRERILNIVWGYQVYPTTRTIDNFILGFRKYFESDSRNPRYFQSVRGVGYKFTEEN